MIFVVAFKSVAKFYKAKRRDLFEHFKDGGKSAGLMNFLVQAPS